MAVDLDPKAVTCDELFGIINPATREWKDGNGSGGPRGGCAGPGVASWCPELLAKLCEVSMCRAVTTCLAGSEEGAQQVWGGGHPATWCVMMELMRSGENAGEAGSLHQAGRNREAAGSGDI